jgi:hypothetical protein
MTAIHILTESDLRAAVGLGHDERSRSKPSTR